MSSTVFEQCYSHTLNHTQAHGDTRSHPACHARAAAAPPTASLETHPCASPLHQYTHCLMHPLFAQSCGTHHHHHNSNKNKSNNTTINKTPHPYLPTLNPPPPHTHIQVLVARDDLERELAQEQGVNRELSGLLKELHKGGGGV